MNKKTFENAVGGVKEEYIDDALSEMTGEAPAVRKSFIPRMLVLLAAALLLTVAAVAGVIALHKAKEPTAVVPPVTETGDPEPASPTQVDPHYDPYHLEPTLEELYADEEYGDLVPRKIVKDMVLVSSYQTAYDPLLSDDGEYDHNITLQFRPNDRYYEPWEWNDLEINVIKDFDVDEHSLFYQLYDPSDAEAALNSIREFSYDDPGPFKDRLKLYVFKAEDYTLEAAEAALKNLSGEYSDYCKAEVIILCGNDSVSYAYTSFKITPEELYDMVTSSRYFENLKAK